MNDVVNGPKMGTLIGGLRLASGQLSTERRSKRTLRQRNAIVATSFELNGMRVLDVGCAEGLQSLYMSGSAKEVWGVDHRSSEIEIGRATAEALGITNVKFRAGDIRDPSLFEGVGKFDLAIAWGFLHRIGDIFSLFYSLEPITNAISLEWRTPVVPMMSELSIAFHPPGRGPLDPMNTGRQADAADGHQITDADKVEGNAAFWEPTPGAVTAMLRRIGYEHHQLIGYDEDLVPEARILGKWSDHLLKANSGKAKLTDLPRARVHMLFEKTPGSIKLRDLKDGKSRLPAWDEAIRAPAVKKKESKKAPVAFDKDAHFESLLANAKGVIDSHFANGEDVKSNDLQINDIDFSRLEIVKYESRQVARMMEEQKELPRAVFRDDEYFYKIWRRGYKLHKLMIVGGKRRLLDLRDDTGVERLPGFLVNFFNSRIASAFAGNIYHNGSLVGYRVHAGKSIGEFSTNDSEHTAFIDEVIEQTVQSGFAFRDLKANNIVRLEDGRLSLIDFDTPLASLYKYSAEVERKAGSLASFTLQKYRDFLTGVLEGRDNRVTHLPEALPTKLKFLRD